MLLHIITGKLTAFDKKLLSRKQECSIFEKLLAQSAFITWGFCFLFVGHYKECQYEALQTHCSVNSSKLEGSLTRYKNEKRNHQKKGTTENIHRNVYCSRTGAREGCCERRDCAITDCILLYSFYSTHMHILDVTFIKAPNQLLEGLESKPVVV